jgi:hypothetical protein
MAQTPVYTTETVADSAAPSFFVVTMPLHAASFGR